MCIRLLRRYTLACCALATKKPWLLAASNHGFFKAKGFIESKGSGGRRGFKEWAEGWVVGGAEREGKTKGFIKPLALKGGCGFSSLMKQRKKGENYADFCFAGKRFFIYIYDVIVKQNFYKRSTNHYSCHSE
jgi:hypothetical protein